jgi:hypothetical protein
MVEQNPKQAIIEFLSVPRSEIMKGKAAVVHFLKERAIAGCQIHAVAFEDEAGEHFYGCCVAGQDATGTWRISGATFSEGDPGTHEPVYKQPSVGLFGGGGYGSAFYAGGYVQDTDPGITEVHLVSNNGIGLKDIVEHGLVLFVTDLPVEMPMTAELYDGAGNLIASQNAFPIPF